MNRITRIILTFFMCFFIQNTYAKLDTIQRYRQPTQEVVKTKNQRIKETLEQGVKDGLVVELEEGKTYVTSIRASRIDTIFHNTMIQFHSDTLTIIEIHDTKGYSDFKLYDFVTGKIKELYGIEYEMGISMGYKSAIVNTNKWYQLIQRSFTPNGDIIVERVKFEGDDYIIFIRILH